MWLCGISDIEMGEVDGNYNKVVLAFVHMRNKTLSPFQGKILGEVIGKMTTSTMRQMQEKGDINPKVLNKVMEKAIPKLLKPKGFAFFPEQNAIAIEMEDGKLQALFVGKEVEGFLCKEVIKNAKTEIAWDDLYETWSGSDEFDKEKFTKFKKRMKDAINRINIRSSKEIYPNFRIISYNREGVSPIAIRT